MHAHTNTLSYTPTNHQTSQIFTNTLTHARACARERTHTHSSAHIRIMRLHMQWAPLLYTMFCPYALDACTLNSNTRTHDAKTLWKGRDTGADTRRAIRKAQSLTYEAGLKNERITVEQDRRHGQQSHSGNWATMPKRFRICKRKTIDASLLESKPITCEFVHLRESMSEGMNTKLSPQVMRK